jgi:hypothetical protein
MHTYALKNFAVLLWDILVDLVTWSECSVYAWSSWIITLVIIGWGAYGKCYGTPDQLSIWTPVQMSIASIPIGWLLGYRHNWAIWDAFWDRLNTNTK